MPTPFLLAIGLIQVDRWSTWHEISRARISAGALAYRRGYVLIETFAVRGVAVADDATIGSLAELAARSSVRVLLVADDVQMSHLAQISRTVSLALDIVTIRDDQLHDPQTGAGEALNYPPLGASLAE